MKQVSAKNVVSDDSTEVLSSPEEIMDWERKLRRRAKSLIQQLETGYLDLGKILYDVVDKPTGGNPAAPPIYRSWGFKTFGEYTEKELGLGLRKAQRLRYIWYRLDVELVDISKESRDRLISLGWTKVRELVRIVNAKNIDEWVTFAKNKSHGEVERAVRSQILTLSEEEKKDTENLPNPPPTDKIKWLRFPLYNEQIDVVDAAVKRAAELTNVEGDKVKVGHLVSMICLDFLSTNDFLSSSVENKLRWIKKMEEMTGLKFVVCDNETKSLLYGIDTLESMFDAYSSGDLSIIEDESDKEHTVTVSKTDDVVADMSNVVSIRSPLDDAVSCD